MIFQKYDSYKDSGLEWLGDIPSEWGVRRVKDNLKHIDQGWSPIAESRKVEKNEWGILKLSSIKQGLFYENEHKTLPSNLKENISYQINKNDVLITRSNTPSFVADACYIKNINLNLMYSDLIYRLKFNSNINIQYFVYLIISNKFRVQISHSYRGLNTSMVKVSGQVIKRWSIAFPPLKTQTKIATYLDTQTLKIDKEIKLLEQKALKYKELKQTLINETVLRGLDEGVKFELKRLKDFITYTIGGEVIDVSYWDNGSELTYTAGKKPVLSTFDKFPDRKRTTKDDILIARNGDGFVHIPKLNSMFTNVVQLVRLSKKVDIRFIWYCLEDTKFKINRMSNGDFIASLNKEMWFNSFLNIPPLKDQTKIATYLDEKTLKIDNITKTISTKIELLKEFRKTLINDTVTGKIKVA